MRTLFLFLCLLPGFYSLPAQTDSLPPPCPCCTGHYTDFDFWIGEWEVYDTTGTRIGTNSIQPKANACILEENWTGGSGFVGSSYNYYDTRDSSWHQLWIDQQGNILEMTGGLQEGSNMVMETGRRIGPEGIPQFNRITWTPHADGSVTQRWEAIQAEDGSVIRLVFLGIYRRRETGG